MSDIDLDDVFLGVLLPWPITLILIVIFCCYGMWYCNQPLSVKTSMCLDDAKEYNLPAKYDEKRGCLVNIGNNHWQKLSKYKKSGIYNDETEYQEFQEPAAGSEKAG